MSTNAGVKHLEDLLDKQTLKTDLEADQTAARIKALQAEAQESISRYQQLLKRVAHEQRVIGDFREVFEQSLRDRKLEIKIAAPTKRTAKAASAEDAVLCISDAHIWKIVEPNRTLGFGHYNPWVFLERLAHLEETVVRLITHNIHNPIRTLHVLFLGDIVDGTLKHSEEIPTRGYVADQVLLAAMAFYQFLTRLSRHVPVVCRGVCGNHGRWGDQKRQPTSGRFSNYDFIVYGMIEAMLRYGRPEEARFDLEEQPFQMLEVGGWWIKIGHGDHLKGGDRALHIPAHAIGREINATTQRYNARRKPAPDYYLVGDKHRHLSVQTATGRYMVNGSWFTDDEFSMQEHFTPGRPHQMFFGIHPSVGKSWSYDIHLDRAPKREALPYKFPQRLLDKVVSHRSS